MRRVAVVTGGAHGIGEAICVALADDDFHVVVTDVSPDGESVAAAINACGRTSTFEPLDVADPAAVAELVEGVMAHHGRLDAWVNNAGVSRALDLFDVDEQAWDEIFAVNARGTFFALRAAARAMVQQGFGRIVNISSVAAKGWGGASNPAYAASKAAVLNLTRMASQRLAPHGITVNAVCPGVTDTELMRNVMAQRSESRRLPLEETLAAVERSIPTHRINSPADIAAAVSFLVSDAARNITGQSVNVDGGRVFD